MDKSSIKSRLLDYPQGEGVGAWYDLMTWKK